MQLIFNLRARLALGVGVLAASALMLTPLSHAAEADTAAAEGTVTPVTREALPNVPGKTLTAVRVSDPPGGKSGPHHHSGSVFAYVVSGALRSQVPGQGPARVYQAGQSFFEPPGSEHLVSANASATRPASLLAVFVADNGAQLTTFDQKPAVQH